MTRTRTRTRTDEMRTALIAPCGMNCRLCRAYMRDRNACPGCRGDDSSKPKTRCACRIKTCVHLAKRGARYCFQCDRFPCDLLERMDLRYRTKYGMSTIENLMRIRELGIRLFLRNEKDRWACPACGAVLCAHLPHCPSCGKKRGRADKETGCLLK